MRKSTGTRQSPLDQHFFTVAERYRRLRDLDYHTARHVAQFLARVARSGRLAVLDVGAGTGRYLAAVVEMAASEHDVVCHGVACDANRFMLSSGAAAARDLRAQPHRVVGLAEALPFREASFDAVLCFNAIQHFDLEAFLCEAGRVLRSGAMLIVYTRTPEQNRRTVWGQLFPMFAEREKRLHSPDELRAAFMGCAKFSSVHIRSVPWTMRTSAARLLQQARGRSYSTFALYEPAEFKAALEVFEQRLGVLPSHESLITVQNDHLVVAARR